MQVLLDRIYTEELLSVNMPGLCTVVFYLTVSLTGDNTEEKKKCSDTALFYFVCIYYCLREDRNTIHRCVFFAIRGLHSWQTVLLLG